MNKDRPQRLEEWDQDQQGNLQTQRIGRRLLRSSSTMGSVNSSSSCSGNNNKGPSEHVVVDTPTSLHSEALPTSTTSDEGGLQIYSIDGHVRLGYCHDSNLREIHPNVFAPSLLTNVNRMGGGGSGVAVFAGTHPELGEIVMKHGGFSDLEELFALETIAEELKSRKKSTGNYDAARKLEMELPSFKMIYISPQHILKQRGTELWGRLKKLVKVGNLFHIKSSDLLSRGSINLDDEMFLTPGMSIRVYESSNKEVAEGCGGGGLSIVFEDDEKSNNNKKETTITTTTKKPSLSFVLGQDSMRFVRSKNTIELNGSSQYESLKSIYDGLLPIMTKSLFKFTLAQKRIGGQNAKTGNQLLYEGKLEGEILDNLVTQFCDTVHNLQKLTLPEEVDVVEQIRSELQELQNDDTVKADQVSPLADRFAGSAIKKNFHPTKGRLRFFRRVCNDLRDKKLVLTPKEEIPAKHLGNLLDADLMSDVFVDAANEPTILDPHDKLWINILARAVDDRKSMSQNALKRVWNSGLADAGIHNLFVSESDLYFFDLGEPQLQSVPGFLTKFLFSFFHTLGMEEDDNGEWVRRFEVKGGKLALTEETKELLPKAYDAFEVALDRVIWKLFDGDEGLRWLLLQYVTLQLLSDASFCLQRWEMKGGGRPRNGNHNTGLEKWLWRALWDCYVAFDINTADSWLRLDVEQNPHCGDSIGDSIRNSICVFDLETLQELQVLEGGNPEDSETPILIFGDTSLRDLTLASFQIKRSCSIIDEEETLDSSDVSG